MTDDGYMTAERIRAESERDVEVNGRRYRVRRLSPAEIAEAIGALPVLPKDDPAKDAPRRRDGGTRELWAQHHLAGLALVVPDLSDDPELVLRLPAQDLRAIVEAALALSGVEGFFGRSRPGDG